MQGVRQNSDSQMRREGGYVTRHCEKARELLPEGGPFTYPNLYRWQTHVEGSLIHAILNATWKPYRDGIFNGKSLNRVAFVQELRIQLAERLGQPANGPGSSSYYQLLSRGNIAEKAIKMPELSLERMKKDLRTSNLLGEIFVEYLSNYFNLDIHFIDLRSMELILSRNIEDHILFTRTRDTIIVGFIDNHYELLSVKVTEEEYPTVFEPQAPIVRKLWQRRNYLRAEVRQRN